MLSFIPALKWVAIAGAIVAVLAGLYYITGLRADLAVSQMNVETLQTAVNNQAKVIQQIQVEQTRIREITNVLGEVAKNNANDTHALRERFEQSSSGTPRDLGRIASNRPSLVERVINNASDNALRCLEIASGAALTERERNATKPSEINPGCPALANPSYKR